MSYLEKSHVVWHCCKCDSINIDSFTFNSYELCTTNMFNPLSDADTTIESVTSCFSPLHTSSPGDNTHRRKSPLKTNPNRPGSVASESNSNLSTTSNYSCAAPAKTANLRLVTVNCCSIVRNRSEFQAAVEYLKPDIICGTESWLRGIHPGKDPAKNSIQSSEVFPESLKVHRNDRPSGLGGGVFVAAQDSLPLDAQPDLTTGCEIIWSKTRQKNNKDLYICSYYMPHRNMGDILALEESLNRFNTQHRDKTIILAGDFNCPDVDWNNLAVRVGAQDREVQQALLDLTSEHGLTQVHHEPTRQNNILDLVFTNNPSIIKTSTSVPGISDHSMVVTDIDVLPQLIKQKKRKIFLFSKVNWEDIQKDTEQLSNSILEDRAQNPVEYLWTRLKDGLTHIMDKHIPSRMTNSRKSLPWFNRKLKQMVRRKARLYKQAKRTNQWNEFNAFQKECKRAFKRAETDHINATIQKGLDENNTKPFWRYVKSRREDKVGISPLKKMGQLYNDSKDKAQILVDQFSSVFTREDPKANLPTKKKLYNQKINPLRVTTEGVKKLLDGININKSKGPDNIANIVLKNCAAQLAPVISYIFQLSIDTGTLPKDWRSANIAPIFKKGNVHLPENYRPVSLTCVTCKLLEHIICRHMLNHLEKNNILTNLNHGFRSGYSCETQLITTIQDILSQQNLGQQIDIAILDFSKAFDTVPHNKLLQKLENYGIDGNINNWLRDFLTNRQMQVVVDGAASDPATVDSGVPQGTVLGPILFLCHINDLPESVKSQVRLFADDCLLYRTIKSPHDHTTLQKDLESLEEWASLWGMRFNAKKCYIMSVNQQSSHFYQLDNHILQQVEENPYLGVTLSSDMKWGTHISKITKKANSTLGFLRRNLKYSPIQCRKTAYLALVRSTLEYSSIVWDPYLIKDIERLEKVQRQAARFIMKDYRSREEGCVTRMLDQLELPSLQRRRKMNRLTFLYRVVEGQVPALPCHDILTKIRGKRQIKPKQFKNCVTTNPIDNQETNNSKCFKTITTRTLQYKNSFFPRTIIEWNKLEDSVVHSKTVTEFKTSVLRCC